MLRSAPIGVLYKTGADKFILKVGGTIVGSISNFDDETMSGW